MKPPVLRCRHVTKRYGKFTALRDLSLEVYEGEIFALLGPNGAGKSTLIHCITGLAKQSKGSIEVLGFDTMRASAAGDQLRPVLHAPRKPDDSNGTHGGRTQSRAGGKLADDVCARR